MTILRIYGTPQDLKMTKKAKKSCFKKAQNGHFKGLGGT